MALKVPITTAMNFEQAMSGVEAVSFGGKASTEEQKAALAALKEQALELGSTTQFTAMQAAQSQENLARAGFTSSQILKAMPGLLDMAAAEGMDLSSAASIAANALRGFNMDASESGRVADVLAKTSAMTNTSISGLGEAMKYVAPVASGLGVSVEETAALLGAMANAGIDASMGGTALRAAFTRLSKEPKAAAKALAALGVASRSANGDMRRLPIIMEDLSKKTAKMGDADRMKHLTNIFGTEAASGMLAIMKAVEKGDLANFEEALKKENVTGTANAMAKARTDNLAGDLTALSSAWEGLNNTVGSAFTPVLRDLTQFLTNTLNKVNGIAKRFPTLTKYAARFAGMFVLKKTVLTGFRIGKDLLSLPILAGKVANATLEASAATGKLTLTQKAAYAFMKVNQYLWDGAKFVGYKAKTLLVAGATKVLAGAQWVLHGAMKAVHAATKAWTAAQWLWNAAMNANPIGAVVIAVGLLTAAGYTLYKNWDKIKQFGLEMWDSIKKKVQAFSDWWDSWTLKDIFAAIPGWCDEVLASLRGKWDEFCNWLKNLFSFNLFGSMDVKVPAPGEQINERHLAAMTGTYLPPEIPGHALGGIITHPMISWLAEDGDEAVVPLENRSRGIPLWMAAGERMGLRFGGGSTTANNYSYTGGSPTINITVSGGGDEPGIAQRIAQAVRDALEDIQSYEGRVAFA
ncbi:MAG: phage tail tape measure protein [Fretibacterium sp.]|nr:phage tail tape measure protein [Fretibacterium sp.]